MFVRRKKNKSGSTTIVVIDKSRNNFRPVRTFGTSLEAEQIENLLKRLTKTFKGGTITKEHINKRGYNKFLEISDDVNVSINRQKIIEDSGWDGWKGYITNTDLSAENVYRQYCELWVIEKAYRVTKGTLELRPMFHFTPRRIEAHVCICFVAYKIYKEMERILKQRGYSFKRGQSVEYFVLRTKYKYR